MPRQRITDRQVWIYMGEKRQGATQVVAAARAGFSERTARRQKDTDARWTKKHGKAHYGYKSHVDVDRRHTLIRRYKVTDASVHDSQAVNRQGVRMPIGTPTHWLH